MFQTPPCVMLSAVDSMLKLEAGMFYTPCELEVFARAKMAAYEAEAARERLLQSARRPSPLRKALARTLFRFAERLAPGQLATPMPARPLSRP